MLGYETRYLIVAGIGWIRWTRVADVEDIWLITFGDEPRAAKGPAGGTPRSTTAYAGKRYTITAETRPARPGSPARCPPVQPADPEQAVTE